MVGIHFQLDGAAPVLPGDVQGLREQCPTDAPTPMLGDHEEFIEPGDETAVLKGPLVGQDRHADRLRVMRHQDRSATLGEIMNTTKTKYRQRISLTPGLMSVLQWHVETQLHTPEQLGSEFLFPAEGGGLRSEACLRKPFAQVAATIGLKKRFTPKGLRRTFNDAARVADLESVVTMSIAGHRTERMRDHYSSVSAGEQRDGIGKVLHLAGAGIPSETASVSGMHCGMHGTQAVLNASGTKTGCA